ncbi:hypothetical protein [uncultured Methanobrevibacter sp.]|uniref:hypothetical protein n=1 Tax=uncultured Methanobrevibacter sp. TaxID=253161 RepID=UPI0025D7F640|nr:hypothetical protein [uncultured Methanobrevibacter sp.]
MDNDKIIIILLVVIVALLVAGMVLFNPFKTQSVLSITSASELNEGDPHLFLTRMFKFLLRIQMVR